MDRNNLRIVGSVSLLIGAVITFWGLKQYSDAKAMVKALVDSDILLGTTSIKSESIWLDKMSNFKIVIIVGAIILVVGLIILISGIISSTRQTNITNREITLSTNDKLLELKNLLDNGLITQDEYDEKKKSILEKL